MAEALQLVKEAMNRKDEKEELAVSEIDSTLLKSFLAEKPIHSHFGITPNDFSQYSDKNKSDMIGIYYKDMLKNKLKTTMTRRRTLFNGEQSMSEIMKIESEFGNEEKNGKPYFNIDPKFSLNSGFDMTLQKKNIPDRTLIYMNDVTESYNAEYKEKYFYLNNVIIAQTLEIDDDGDHDNLNENECLIYVPRFCNNNMKLEKTKAYTTVRGDDDAEFFDFGYDEFKIPFSKRTKRNT